MPSAPWPSLAQTGNRGTPPGGGGAPRLGDLLVNQTLHGESPRKRTSKRTAPFGGLPGFARQAGFLGGRFL